jgi:hypothetical protein
MLMSVVNELMTKEWSRCPRVVVAVVSPQAFVYAWQIPGNQLLALNAMDMTHFTTDPPFSLSLA